MPTSHASPSRCYPGAATALTSSAPSSPVLSLQVQCTPLTRTGCFCTHSHIHTPLTRASVV
jgi:hypothetical protein